jgi:hypothetical protein
MGLFIERKERWQQREQWWQCYDISLEGGNACQWKCKHDIKVQPGPHAFMAWGSFSILYALPPPPPIIHLPTYLCPKLPAVDCHPIVCILHRHLPHPFFSQYLCTDHSHHPHLQIHSHHPHHNIILFITACPLT